MLTLDPHLFTEDAISEETGAFNRRAVGQIEASGDAWAHAPSAMRAARLEGRGFFPQEAAEPSATMATIPGPNGSLPVRLLRPRQGEARGTFLHIHGGGWQVGSALSHDGLLQGISDACGLVCASVDYRLAPEHPYPAGPDDCEQAALWLISGYHDLPTGFLAIGGESAGAHLSAVTLLRLRDRHGLTPFHGAVLTAGVYDLGQTASCRNWGDERLVLNTRDMAFFVKGYLQNGENSRNGEISPLYAPLQDMPPALFSVGTRDLLLDDTLMMATRWHAENANAQWDITPGGCHVFQYIAYLTIAAQSRARIHAFLNARADQQAKSGSL